MCMCVLYGEVSVFGGISFGNWIQRNHAMFFFFLEEEREVCVGRPKCVLGL